MPNTSETQVIDEIFGDKFRTFDLTKIEVDGNPFWGTKYADKDSRASSKEGAFSTDRSAGVSIALFALAAEGRYTFEDLMDNSKLRAEKAEMFDFVMNATKKDTPESKEWIAEQLYFGFNSIMQMMEDAAKEIDFSKPDLIQDKKFCMLLHMVYHQFDAYQEMERCSEEITRLAIRDNKIPGIKEYKDYSAWVKKYETPLRLIQEDIKRQRSDASAILSTQSVDVIAGNVAMYTVHMNKIIDEMAKTQKRKQGKSLFEWFDPQKNQEFELELGMTPQIFQESFRFLKSNPKLAVPVMKELVNGSVLDDADMRVDMQTRAASVTGIPSEKSMRELFAQERKKVASEHAVDEVLGSSLRVYNETDTLHAKDNPFYGNKSGLEARKAAVNPYSVQRTAGVSLAIFALAVTGKYSLDDLMDNSKFRDEKKAAFDEIIDRTNNPNPENQKWIANLLYEGRKTTFLMMDEEIRKINFNKSDIMQDPRFCKLLHMAHVQFDAGQETKWCGEEIVALESVKRELKGVDDYEKFLDWWTQSESPLSLINESIAKMYREVAGMADTQSPSQNVGNTVMYLSRMKGVINDIARIKEKNPAKEFEKWFDADYKTKLNWGLMSATDFQKCFKSIESTPELTVPFAKQLVSGPLLDKVRIDVDSDKLQCTVSGLPNEEKIRKLIANTASKEKTDVNDKHKQLSEVYTVGDVEQGRKLGGSFLYGMLGDVLDPEHQREIYRKICVMDAVEHGEWGSVNRSYGMKAGLDAKEIANDRDSFKKPMAGGIKRRDLPQSYYEKFGEIAEPHLATYIEGVKDLLQVAEKKVNDGKIKTAMERRSFSLMKSFLEDIADGSFSSKMKKDPIYASAAFVFDNISKTVPVYTLRGNVNNANFKVGFVKKVDDQANLKILNDSGLLEGLEQSVLTNKLLAQNMKGGNVTRNEMIAANKYLSHKMEDLIRGGKLDELKAQDVIGDLNVKERCKIIRFEAANRADLLEKGYPAADVEAMGYFAQEMRKLEKSVKRLKKKVDEKQKADPDSNSKEFLKMKELLGKTDHLLKSMQDTWQEVKTTTDFTEVNRRKILGEMSNLLKDLPDGLKQDRFAAFAIEKLEERKEKNLSPNEHALFADKVSKLYELLDKTDPGLMRSSSQFRKMKKELKELIEWQEATEEKSVPENISGYKEHAQKTADAVKEYLQYKSRQMAGGHKRSEAEAKRVAMADAILDSLNRIELPRGRRQMLLEERVTNAVMYSGADLFDETMGKDNLPKGYDSYIRLHTGKGAINGTLEQLRDDVSKVMAASLLQKNARFVEFDVKNIHKCAKQIRKESDIEKLGEEALREILQSPESVSRSIEAKRKKAAEMFKSAARESSRMTAQKPQKAPDKKVNALEH